MLADSPLHFHWIELSNMSDKMKQEELRKVTHCDQYGNPDVGGDCWKVEPVRGKNW